MSKNVREVRKNSVLTWSSSKYEKEDRTPECELTKDPGAGIGDEAGGGTGVDAYIVIQFFRPELLEQVERAGDSN